tara:strand:+ start:1735 stop:2049 length:315 start_codon:yes stop_codon:yes gene_type:complete
MKHFLNFFLFLTISLILGACSGLKENLSLKKKQGVDEFLIERKEPLTVPPDFTSLPKPRNSSSDEIDDEQNIDLKKVLNKSKETDQISSSDDLEKSISDILNKR